MIKTICAIYCYGSLFSRRYISLYKRLSFFVSLGSTTAASIGSSSGGGSSWLTPLTGPEFVEFQHCEDSLTFDQCVLFRELALAELEGERRMHRQEADKLDQV